MKQALTILIYIVLVFGGAALISPWIFHGLQALATSFPQLTPITQQPFHRYVNRALIILALIGLWPMARTLGIRSLRDLGFSTSTSRSTPPQRPLLHGWLIGFLGLAAVILITLLAQGRVPRPDIHLSRIVQTILSAAATAAIVAVLEEILFRGALYGRLRQPIGHRAALFVSATLYAIMHFFARPAPPAEVHAGTGFVILAGMLEGFTHVEELIPGFLTLTLAGLLLAQAYQRSGTLWLPIGIHAGWIFWMKIYGSLTVESAQASRWFWGSHKLVDGWLAFLIMCATAFWIHQRIRPAPPSPAPPKSLQD